MEPFRLLIVGIGDPVPTFIYRRLVSLIESGIHLTIVAKYKQELQLDGAEIVRIGGVKSLAQHVMGFLRVVFAPVDFLRMLSLRPELRMHSRLRWAIDYFPLTQIAPPNVIHLQWIASVSGFEWLRSFFSCPIVGSARGSQVTVYPYTRIGFRDVLMNSFRQVDYVHCVSQSMVSACRKLGAPERKLFLNYNGIDSTVFCPASDRTEGDSVLKILTVGGLMWRKGHLFQLLIIKKLVDRKRSVHLTIVGGGEAEEAILYNCYLLGLQDHVTMLGVRDSGEVLSIMQRSDVYLSTSAAEGLSNSVLEAASCGIPVVCFCCEGMEEIIDEGRTGFIVPFGDVDAVVDRLEYLIRCDGERISIGMALRTKILQQFDMHYWSKQMIKFYRAIEKQR